MMRWSVQLGEIKLTSAMALSLTFSRPIVGGEALGSGEERANPWSDCVLGGGSLFVTI